MPSVRASGARRVRSVLATAYPRGGQPIELSRTTGKREDRNRRPGRRPPGGNHPAMISRAAHVTMVATHFAWNWIQAPLAGAWQTNSNARGVCWGGGVFAHDALTANAGMVAAQPAKGGMRLPSLHCALTWRLAPGRPSMVPAAERSPQVIATKVGVQRRSMELGGLCMGAEPVVQEKPAGSTKLNTPSTLSISIEYTVDTAAVGADAKTSGAITNSPTSVLTRNGDWSKPRPPAMQRGPSIWLFRGRGRSRSRS